MKLIRTNNEPFNFDPKLQPLYDAMAMGERIKSVTCFSGMVNKDDRSKDFVVKDFVAETYYVSLMTSSDNNIHYDFVSTNEGKESFYMNWVMSFEL